MKRIFLLIAAFASLLMLGACSDKENENEIVPEEESGTDYLVMLYASGGTTLDASIVANIIQAIDEGCNDKVKMTFEYKLSYAYQNDAKYANFAGTRRFTYDDNAHLTGTFKSQSTEYPFLDEQAFDYYLQELKSEQIGDAEYMMSAPEPLGDFIRWSKSQYPDAKHTLLIISSHGNGWKIDEDTQTRGIFSDDNISGSKNMSAQDVADGMNLGGGVDLLYTDACLMSMYENLYAYAKGAKYLVASVEPTPDDGGDYRKLISLLKAAGPEETDFVDAICKFTDYSTSDEWWSRQGGETQYSDLSLYDLSKLDNVTPVMSKIAKTLTEKYDHHIRKALTSCVTAFRFDGFSVWYLPTELIPYLHNDGIDPYIDSYGDEVVNFRKLIDWVRLAPTDNAKEAYYAYTDEWELLRRYIVYHTFCSFSLVDMLRIADKEFKADGIADNPFGPLHDELIEALRSMSHISYANPNTLPGIDLAYDFSSPGICIIPLNESFNSYLNYQSEAFGSYEDALKAYQSSDFDKAVGWSSFLQLVDVIPSVLFNPGRDDLDKIQ